LDYFVFVFHRVDLNQDERPGCVLTTLHFIHNLPPIYTNSGASNFCHV
jgi:hypothetical protein